MGDTAQVRQTAHPNEKILLDKKIAKGYDNCRASRGFVMETTDDKDDDDQKRLEHDMEEIVRAREKLAELLKERKRDEDLKLLCPHWDSCPFRKAPDK